MVKCLLINHEDAGLNPQDSGKEQDWGGRDRSLSLEGQVQEETMSCPELTR